MKKTNVKTLLLTAAVSGVLAGIAAPVQASTTPGIPVLMAQSQPADKNSCKGKNSCSGKQDQTKQDQTKTDKKDSQPTDKDKNSCKGRNGCGGSAPKA